MKKYIITIVVVVTILPLILNWLIIQPRRFEVVGDENVWLSFWGSYLGAIISACTAFFILNRQINANKEENNKIREENEIQNEKNRQLQLNFIKYQQEKARLDELKIKLSDYYNIFNYNELSRIGDMILSSNPEQMKEAKSEMQKIADTMNSINFKIGLLFPKNLNEFDLPFLTKKNSYCEKLTALIEDFDWLIYMKLEYWHGEHHINKNTIQIETLSYEKKHKSPNITDYRITDIMKRYDYNIFSKYKEIVACRMKSIDTFKPKKIQEVISEFIDNEQDRIDKILLCDVLEND